MGIHLGSVRGYLVQPITSVLLKQCYKRMLNSKSNRSSFLSKFIRSVMQCIIIINKNKISLHLSYYNVKTLIFSLFPIRF